MNTFTTQSSCSMKAYRTSIRSRYVVGNGVMREPVILVALCNRRSSCLLHRMMASESSYAYASFFSQF